MRLYKIVLLMMLVAFLFMIGCSDRGVNYDKDTFVLEKGSSVPKTGAHVFTHELSLQIQNKFQQLPLKGYLPKIAFEHQAGGEYKAVPLLVLLPPQDGDENFFFQHGLIELADEMISKGEIQPMAILCVPNDKIFGGYFFAGSSPAAGYYDSLIGDELIKFAEEAFIMPTIRTKEKRAIGGFGMGAYGAYRAAMLHPDMFSAVSGVSGPMDFDGANNASGLMTLFDDVLIEQGIMGLNLSNAFSYQGDWHLSRLFVGGGFAFASHETEIYYYDSVITPVGQPDKLKFYLDSFTTLDTNVYSLADAVNFPGYAVPPNAFENNLGFTYNFYLPFDNAGNVVTPVWDLWLNNNLPNMLLANPNAYAGMNLWMANSNESTFGNYNEQTDSWVSALRNTNYIVSEYNITGYDGHPANKDQYVYDILREMLIFHSESFGE